MNFPEMLPELGFGEISLILNIFLFMFIIIIFALMSKEARHFFGLKGKGDVFSLITMPPGGGGLILKKVKWTGEYFEHKNEAIYLNFDFLEDPVKDSEKKFNEILKRATFWAYSKVPVLMGYEASSFICNPGILMHIEASRDVGENTDDKTYENAEKVLNYLKDTIKPKVSRITIIKPFTVSAIREFLGRSSNSQKQRNLVEKGRIIGRLEMTKPKPLGSIPMKVAIPIAAIVIILILAGSGAFGDIGAMFQQK